MAPGRDWARALLSSSSLAPAVRLGQRIGIEDDLGATACGDCDLPWHHHNGAAAAFKGDRRGRLDLDGIAGIEGVLASDGRFALHWELLSCFLVRAMDADDLVAVDGDVLVAADIKGLVALHVRGHVELGLDVQLFLAFQILEADFVEVAGGAVLAAAALDSRLGLVVGQRIGRHVVGIVDPPGDDWLVGIALQEVDDDFLADARNVDGAPLRAGPHLGHAHPA